MKRRTLIVLFILSIMMIQNVDAQKANVWKGKKCAVVLTYDDALNVHLDNVIPCLDSAGFNGTFYIIGQSEVLSKRLPEWRSAAKRGHELGNHTLTHPCDGILEGRSWVSAENDLTRYSFERVVREIRVTNTLLQAIDGKTERSFAYPCGDLNVGGVTFYDSLRNEFAGARGVQSGIQSIDSINLDNINSFYINGHSSAYMIELVKKAMESNSLLVFMFHGVGGEHNINVSTEAHSQLVHYLKQHKNEIWVAPMVDVAKFVKAKQH